MRTAAVAAGALLLGFLATTALPSSAQDSASTTRTVQEVPVQDAPEQGPQPGWPGLGGPRGGRGGGPDRPALPGADVLEG